MRVRVLRVADMPHDTQVLAVDRPHEFTLYVDQALITEDGARLLAATMDVTVQWWIRIAGAEERPHLTLHTG